MSYVEGDFDRRFSNDHRVVKYKGTLEGFISDNPDLMGVVDVVYVDADHGYSQQRKDLQLSKSLQPAFISGHDYTKKLNGGDEMLAINDEFGKPDKTF